MRSRLLSRLLPLLAFAAALGVPAANANASERLFSYSYEPKTLPKGTMELEPWATARIGKASGIYNRYDLRTEFEMGLTDHLLAAVYFNFRSVHQDGARAGQGFARSAVSDATTFKGISNEWILKLTDPAADPLGVALYFEWKWEGGALEIEPKLLLGKAFGDVILAYNCVFEWEWEFEHEAKESKMEVERDKFLWINTFGASLAAGGGVRVGVEGFTRSRWNQFTRPRYTSVFVGPNVHVAADGWWLTLTVAAQCGASNPTSHGLEFTDNERVEVRFILGFEIRGGPAAPAAAPVAAPLEGGWKTVP